MFCEIKLTRDSIPPGFQLSLVTDAHSATDQSAVSYQDLREIYSWTDSDRQVVPPITRTNPNSSQGGVPTRLGVTQHLARQVRGKHLPQKTKQNQTQTANKLEQPACKHTTNSRIPPGVVGGGIVLAVFQCGRTPLRFANLMQC